MIARAHLCPRARVELARGRGIGYWAIFHAVRLRRPPSLFSGRWADCPSCGAAGTFRLACAQCGRLECVVCYLEDLEPDLR